MNKRLFKRFISTALSAMLVFSCFTVPAPAEENTAVTDTKAGVNAELSATAKSMCDYIKNKISGDESVPDHNDFKNYTLVLKSGYSDETVTKKLTDFVKTMINDTANPISATYEDEYSGNALTLSGYFPYIIAFLNEAGENSSDFNGYNFNRVLEEAYLNENVIVNPWLEQYIVSAVEFNREAFLEPDKIISKAQKSILDSYTSDEYGTGINYWGVSADNNGQCLSVLKSLYKNDNDVKEKIDAALSWTATQFSDNGEIIYYGSPNPSSTALALKAFSEFGDFENAAKAFNGMASFKSSTISGVYEGYNYSTNEVEADYLYATPDALMGLLAYSRSLEGHDTLEVIVPENEPVSEPSTEPSTEPDTKAEEESTTLNEETSTSAPATVSASDKDKELPPTGDTAPIAVTVTAAILALSLAVYFGLNKKNAK